jgi:hypothetical protein
VRKKKKNTMYIRDAQGRLRWIPPPTFVDPHMMTAPIMMVPGPMMSHQQQALRNHVQDEWAKFNAPPTTDAMHYIREEPFYGGGVVPNTAQNMMPPVAHMPIYNNMNRMQMYHYFHQQRQQQRRQQQQMYNPEPPIPRVITPVHFDIDEGPPSSVVFSPSIVSSVEESRSRSRPQSVSRHHHHHNDFEDAAAQNVSCMDTLFGSQVKPLRPTRRNRLDPSTTELDLKIKIPDHYTEHLKSTGKHHPAVARKSIQPSQDQNSSIVKDLVGNPMQVFHCNGVRGPGTKFDYSCTSPGMAQFRERQGLLAMALAKKSKRPSLAVQHPNFIKGDGKAGTGQISPHDSLDDVTYLVENEYDPSKQKVSHKKGHMKQQQQQTPAVERQSRPLDGRMGRYEPTSTRHLNGKALSFVDSSQNRPVKKKQPIVEPESSKDDMMEKYESKMNNTRNEILRDDDNDGKKERRKKINVNTTNPTKDNTTEQSSTPKWSSNTDDVGEPGATKSMGLLIKSDQRSHGKIVDNSSRRHRVQWDDVDGNGTKHEGPIFSAKDQADLAQSIREICLERMGRAPSDIEEYPSFDEHKSEQPTVTTTVVVQKKKEGMVLYCGDESSSDTSSSAIENHPEHANNKKAARSNTKDARRLLKS